MTNAGLKHSAMEKIKELFYRIIQVHPDSRSLIPRLVVGLVFLSEGIQKYIMPEVVGAGRFERIGFENFEFLSCFVATFEILCGILLLAGFVVRLSAIPLLIIMFTAIASTKIPILMADGFWIMAHAARTDFAMTMSVDSVLRKNSRPTTPNS
jgi:putative oxidoreductase